MNKLVETMFGRLLLTFSAWVVTILAFAGVYYSLYLDEPARFAFNGDILRQQRDAFLTSAQQEHTTLRSRLELLNELLSFLNDHSDPPEIRRSATEDAAVIETPHHRYTFVFRVLSSSTAGNPPMPVVNLTIANLKGEVLDRLPSPSSSEVGWLPRTSADCRHMTLQYIARFEAEATAVKTRLDTVSDPSPHVWSFPDFVYFSAITQTTVGYGDMLPNSTPVRMVVVLQLMIGTALLVVVINLVVTDTGWRKPATGADRTAGSDSGPEH